MHNSLKMAVEQSTNNHVILTGGKALADAKKLVIDDVPLSSFMGDYNVPVDASPGVMIALSEWEDFVAGQLMYVGGNFDPSYIENPEEYRDEEREGYTLDDDDNLHEQVFSKGQRVRVKGEREEYWFACNTRKNAKLLDELGMDRVVKLKSVKAI